MPESGCWRAHWSAGEGFVVFVSRGIDPAAGFLICCKTSPDFEDWEFHEKLNCVGM